MSCLIRRFNQDCVVSINSLIKPLPKYFIQPRVTWLILVIMSLKVPGLFRFVISLKVRIKFFFCFRGRSKTTNPITLVIRQLKNFKRVTAPTLLFSSKQFFRYL